MPGFQLKNFVSIVAAMINHARASQDKVTDFEVGSVIRTIMESPAVEIEELYQRVFSGILDAIPTAIYKGFNFELISETAASGYVRITFGTPIVEEFTIPAGTVFSAPGVSLRFASTAPVVVAVSATQALVPVVCATLGTVGNVAAGAITGTVNFNLPAGATVSNDAFLNGRDEQSEAERKARFADFILSLSRGTVPALRYAVQQAQITNAGGQLLEYVARVGVIEEAGRVLIYIYGSGGAPSSALIAKAQQIIDGYRDPDTGTPVPGYRAAGVEVQVLPMAERFIPVTLQVQPLFGVTGSPALKDAIATALTPEFDAVEAGEILYVGELIDAALTVPGVQKVTAGGNANEPCAATEVLRLGAFTVEWTTNA